MFSKYRGEDSFYTGEDRMEEMRGEESVVIEKNEANEIGFIIGGGAPNCPILYIVQIDEENLVGKLNCGDELLRVNGFFVKGKNKDLVMEMIKSILQEVTIHFKKLHAESRHGNESLETILIKTGLQLIDKMSHNRVDSMKFSLEIYSNDSLVKRLKDLQAADKIFRDLTEHTKRMINTFINLMMSLRIFANVYSEMDLNEIKGDLWVYTHFAELHIYMELYSVILLQQIHPVLNDLEVYTNGIIPKTRLAVQKYARAKFSYYAYCMKVKELDFEEQSATVPLNRVQTGNYEYRIVVRSRQMASQRLAALHKDVENRFDSIESENTMQLVQQLEKKINDLKIRHIKAIERLDELSNKVSIPDQLKKSIVQYKMNILHAEEEHSLKEENTGAIGVLADEKPITSDAEINVHDICNFGEMYLSQLALKGNVEAASSEYKANNDAPEINTILNELSTRMSRMDLLGGTSGDSFIVLEAFTSGQGATTSGQGATTSGQGATTSGQGASISGEGTSSGQLDDFIDD